MSQSCGNLQFVEGGTIKSSSIINSQITDSIISNSTLQSVKLESLSSVDGSSAKVIADAIAALPPDQLITLVNAILASFTATPQTEPAVGTGTGELPTTVYGDRAALMGKPQMFAQFGQNYIIPLYRSGV